METVVLSGEGAIGLVPDGDELRQQIAMLPREVKLGRRQPLARRLVPRLEQFVDTVESTPKPAVDWYTKARESLSRMYLNDRYGCCVFSGKAHNLGIWSVNDPDSADGQTVLATDQEIADQYFNYTGGRDQGAIISEVLDIMVQRGFRAGGKHYKILGYVSADPRSKELTQIGLDLFGCGSIGFALPSSWQNQAVWDITNSRIVGGHDVSPCGYGANVLGTNADGVVVSSWGRLYLFTWSAWTSGRYIDELYFMVPEFLWTGLDSRAPSGVDLSGLNQALSIMRGGGIPPLPEPLPPPPPSPPPSPPSPVPTMIHVPQQPVYILGMNLGYVPPYTLTLGARSALTANIDWRHLLNDVGTLLTQISENKYTEAANTLFCILKDFGFFGGYSSLPQPTVPWFTVIVDALALIKAVYSKNPAAVLAALLKLASDFGLSLQ